MPVPPEVRPFSHALDRAERDGLRGQAAYLRALELLIVEQGDAAARSLLAATRDALAGCVMGLGASEVELQKGRDQAGRLAALSQAGRLRRIKASRPLRGPALTEALLERARAALPGDPSQGPGLMPRAHGQGERHSAQGRDRTQDSSVDAVHIPTLPEATKVATGAFKNQSAVGNPGAAAEIQVAIVAERLGTIARTLDGLAGRFWSQAQILYR